MKKSLLVTLTIYFVTTLTTYAQQCGTLMEPVSLEKRIKESTQIVEGKVKKMHSLWDNNKKNIYTIYSIDVYNRAKGSGTETINVTVLGGQVDDEIQMTSSSANLYNGDQGIFFLKKSFVQFPVRGDVYEMVAAAQGFIKYNELTGKASGVFEEYESIENVLIKKIQKVTRTNWEQVQLKPAKSKANNAVLITPTILAISHTSINAGIGNILTIDGFNFGTLRGKVSFPNANTGGTTYFDALDSQIVSWTDLQIKVRVPTNAGTGKIRVTNSDPVSTDSSQILKINFSHLSLTSGGIAYPSILTNNDGNGGYTFQYNNDFNSSIAKGSFEDAFQLWNCETFVNFNFGATTTTDETARDDINIVRFDNGDELPTGVLGQVTRRYIGICALTDSAIVGEIDITWDDDTNWYYGGGAPSAGLIDFKSVALHELGHAHQLGHVINSNSVMHYAIASGVTNYSLNADDIRGANHVMRKFTAPTGCSDISPMIEDNQCCTDLAINLDPSAKEICEGEDTSFRITATAAARYQWQVNDGSWNYISNSSIYSGATTSVLTVNNAPFSLDENQYRCIIWSSCGGSLISDRKTLTVKEVPIAMVAVQNATCAGGDGQIIFDFTDNSTRTGIEFSIDNGVSFPYAYNDNAGSESAKNLAAGNYDVWVRWDNDECPVDLGSYAIIREANPTATISVTDSNCGSNNGILTFSFADTGTRNMIQFSIDNGVSYAYTFDDDAGTGMAPDLAAGDYDVWVSYDNDDCPVSLGSFTIGIINTPPVTITTNTDETVCDTNDGSISLSLVDSPGQTIVEISLNGGTSYDYSYSDALGSIAINNLDPGDYNVWARWEDDSCAQEIGDVTIGSGLGIDATVSNVNPSRGMSDGRILVSFTDNASQTQIKFSIDGGITYPYTFNDNLGTAEIAGLSATNYDVWAAYGDDTCPAKIADIILSEINYTDIPDTNFESALNDLSYDNYLGDNKVPTSLINVVTSLDIKSNNIANLSGIEDFSSLTLLDVSDNNLTTLDLSPLSNLENLIVSNNNIATVDISSNTKLVSFIARSTGLNSMDFTPNTLLVDIDVNDNNLTSLDFSLNLSLVTLDVASNALTYLDAFLAFYEDITFFDARSNPDLTCIRVEDPLYSTTNWLNIDSQTSFSGNYCEYTAIPDANFEATLGSQGYDDISGDGQVPTSLINTLTTLDVSNKGIVDPTGIEDFTELIFLNMRGNSILSIDLSNLSELETLNIQRNNDMTTLNLDDLLKLEILIADFNNISELTLVSPELRILQLFGNELTSLDVSLFPELKQLYCGNNLLTGLDLNQNTKLELLSCARNSIESLDLSGLPLLNEILVDRNELSVLNLKNGNNANITSLNVLSNSQLNCISVDDPVAANAGSGIYGSWTIDAGATYNDDCTQPVITLDGENPQIIELGVGYTELGANTDDGSTVVIDATAFMDVVGNYTITYNATNAIGNSAVEVTRIVNVVDTTNPIAICQDINVALNSSGTVTIIGTQVDNSSSDLSGIASLAVSPSSFTTSDVGANTVTLTVTDTNGNSETCTSTVTVVDTIAPTMACQDITVQLDTTGNVSITATQVDGGTTDAAGIASLNIDITDFDDTDIGENMVTLTAIDNNGNTDTCVAIVTVEDNVPPVITLTGDNPQVIELGDGYTELGAMTDDGSNVVIDATNFVDAVGNYTIYYDATDASGNMAVQVTRMVNIVDTTAPVITLVGDNPQTIELGSGYTELRATTDDGSNVMINATDFVDAVGSYTIYYDATDASGNMADQVTRVVNVVDTTAPVITLGGDNPQTIELGTGYTELGATTDDGSDAIIDMSDFVDALGSYTITYKATDASGNVATEVTRTIHVVDTTAPVISLVGDNPQTIELGAGYIELGATVDDGSTVVIDSSGFIDAVGNYAIRYNATDASGNVATEVTRAVDVVDTTNPTLVCQNITVQLDNTGNVVITADQVDNGATDLSGIASLSLDISTFDCATIGDHTVVLTAIDTNGNESSCTATVTVEDLIAPVFNTTTLPSDTEVTFDTGDIYTLADFTNGVVVTDNCDTNRAALATTITQTPAAGTLLGAGDHVIILTATDDNANEQTTTFTITVTDDVLSVGENKEEVFTLYPNPAKQQFQVSGFSGEAELSIYDVNGRSLLIEKVDAGQSISIEELPNGLYFVRIAIGTTYQTIKLLKNE
ncbi:immunoglobulin-like domain-containing protein [uncultured Aquimarina sp.]|uniref:immunoglobulin-like domain-containing protein n=1 Tax=uncultured Aquimarina sp. TaxID=575652 RepID=UPI00260882F6|nr:immunoglobulin-like domain-containing protein [uncultured Aquimarina sp.]